MRRVKNVHTARFENAMDHLEMVNYIVRMKMLKKLITECAVCPFIKVRIGRVAIIDG